MVITERERNEIEQLAQPWLKPFPLSSLTYMPSQRTALVFRHDTECYLELFQRVMRDERVQFVISGPAGGWTVRAKSYTGWEGDGVDLESAAADFVLQPLRVTCSVCGGVEGHDVHCATLKALDSYRAPTSTAWARSDC